MKGRQAVCKMLQAVGYSDSGILLFGRSLAICARCLDMILHSLFSKKLKERNFSTEFQAALLRLLEMVSGPSWTDTEV